MRPFDLSDIEVEKIILEKMRVSTEEFISEEQLNLMDISFERRMEFFNNLGRVMAIRLNAFVLCHEDAVIKVEYPSTWWQAFKEKYLDTENNWFWKHHPVRYMQLKWEVKSKYPTLKIDGRKHTAVQEVFQYRATSALT